MRWGYGISVLAAVLLAGCGGDGGGDEVAVSSPSRESISVVGGEVPVQRERLQIIKVTGIDIGEDGDSYPATVDGIPASVTRALDNSLLLLLPSSLPAGTHQLVVVIDEVERRVRFQSADPVIASRDASLAGLALSFGSLRMMADEAINELIESDAGASVIDDMEAHRDALDVERPDIQSMTDQELDYLNKFLAVNFPGDAALPGAEEATLARDIEGCRMRRETYATQFTRMLVAIDVGAHGNLDLSVAFSSAGSSVAASASAIVVHSEGRKTLDEFDHLVRHCFQPVANSLQESTVAVSLAPRTTSLVDPESRDYEQDLANAYHVETDLVFAMDVLDILTDARITLERMAFLVPDDAEAQLRERLVESYAEDLPAEFLSLQQISDPEITGELTPTGDKTFDLEFRKHTGLPFEASFTFVLRDSLNDIETRYTARLWSGGHCPDFTAELANVVVTPDRCIVIQDKPESDVLDYQEYHHKNLVLRELYEVGDTPNINLKASKGLDGAEGSHIPDLWVERIQSLHEYIVMLDTEGTPSVRQREVFYVEDGGDQEILYSEPLLQRSEAGDLYWDALPRESRLYHKEDPTVVETYGYFTDPFQDDDGYWQSVLASDISFDVFDVMVSYTNYTAPLQAPGGIWVSAPAEFVHETRDMYGNVTRSETLYNWPVFSDAGVMQTPIYSFIRKFNGLPLDESFFSVPVKNAEGNWTSVTELVELYGDQKHETLEYSTPLQQTDGEWASVLSMHTEVYVDGTVKYSAYSEPVQTVSGEWISMLASTISEGPLGREYERYYYDPIPAQDGTWHHVLESESEYESGVKVLYTSYAIHYMDSIGLPDSAPSYSEHWSGDTRTQIVWSEPVEEDGRAVSTALEKRVYENDWLVEQTLYTNPLLDNDGTWSSFELEVRRYSAGQLSELVMYWLPEQVLGGHWATSLRSRTTWLAGSRTEYQYSYHLIEPSGEALTSLIQNRKSYNADTLETENFYAAPYLDEFNSWVTYLQRVNYYLDDCYQERNQDGVVVTDTCSP